MNPGEIFLANFPFGGSAGMKLRTVLLLTGAIGSVPEVLVAYISSVIPATLLPTDVILDPTDPRYATTKLKIKSVLRLHKLATIHQTSLVRQLGRHAHPGEVVQGLYHALSPLVRLVPHVLQPLCHPLPLLDHALQGCCDVLWGAMRHAREGEQVLLGGTLPV